MPIHKKIASRRKSRKAAGKWTAGELLTKSGRKRASARHKSKTFKTPEQQVALAKKHGSKSVQHATKQGYTALQARKQKKVAAKRAKLESPKGLGSAAYKRMSKLGVDSSKFKLKRTKKKSAPKKKSSEKLYYGGSEPLKAKGMGIQTAAIKKFKKKRAAGKSWKKATTASKKSGVKMTDLIKKRNSSKKGTAAYATAQNQINKFYGSKKVHKAKSVKKTVVRNKWQQKKAGGGKKAKGKNFPGMSKKGLLKQKSSLLKEKKGLLSKKKKLIAGGKKKTVGKKYPKTLKGKDMNRGQKMRYDQTQSVKGFFGKIKSGFNKRQAKQKAAISKRTAVRKAKNNPKLKKNKSSY